MKFDHIKALTFSKSDNASRGEFSEALFHGPRDVPRRMSSTQHSNRLLLHLDVIDESGHDKKRAGSRRENKSTLYSAHVMPCDSLGHGGVHSRKNTPLQVINTHSA